MQRKISAVTLPWMAACALVVLACNAPPPVETSKSASTASPKRAHGDRASERLRVLGA